WRTPRACTPASCACSRNCTRCISRKRGKDSTMLPMKELTEEKAPGQPMTAPEPPLRLSELRVTRLEDGRCRAAWAGQSRIVRVGTCFPWSAPGAFVSLRGEDDKEIALIPSLDDVDPESRAVL